MRALGEDFTILQHAEFRVLLFINFTLTLGVVPLAPVLNSLTQPFGVTESAIGLIITAFIIPSIVLTPFLGMITDAIGRKPVFIVCLAVFGAAGVAIAFVDRFELVLGLRVIQGIGFAGASPLVITCIGDLYRPPQGTTAQGLSFMTVGIAEAVFPVLIGVVVTIAWQFPFFLYALALVAAIVVYGWFPEPTDESPESDVPDTQESMVNQLLFVVRQRRSIAFILALSASSFVYTGFITYISFLISDKGGDAATTGAVVALASVVLAASSTQAGRVAEAWGNRTHPLIIASAVQAIAILGIVIVPLRFIYPLAVVLGIGNGLIFPLSRSIITDLSPVDIRGSFVSLAESIGRIGVALGPAMMGAFVAVSRHQIGTDGAVKVAVALVTAVFTVLMIAFLALALYSTPIKAKHTDEVRDVT